MNFEDLKIGCVLVFNYNSDNSMAYKIIGLENNVIQDELIWAYPNLNFKNKVGYKSSVNWSSSYKKWIHYKLHKLYMPGKWSPSGEAFKKHRERLLAS